MRDYLWAVKPSWMPYLKKISRSLGLFKDIPIIHPSRKRKDNNHMQYSLATAGPQPKVRPKPIPRPPVRKPPTPNPPVKPQPKPRPLPPSQQPKDKPIKPVPNRFEALTPKPIKVPFEHEERYGAWVRESPTMRRLCGDDFGFYRCLSGKNREGLRKQAAELDERTKADQEAVEDWQEKKRQAQALLAKNPRNHRARYMLKFLSHL